MYWFLFVSYFLSFELFPVFKVTLSCKAASAIRQQQTIATVQELYLVPIRQNYQRLITKVQKNKNKKKKREGIMGES